MKTNYHYGIINRTLVKASIKLSSGKSLTVTANNLSDENIYVKKVFLNGEKLNRTYITFDEVLNGGELRFEMTK